MESQNREVQRLAHNKGEKLIELKLESTHDVALYCINSMTVMPSSGQVVVHGDNHKDQYASKTLPKYALHVYELQAGDWTQRILTVTCKHEGVELHGMTLHGEDRLAISCPKCQNITLLDLQTGESEVAYSSTEYRPDYMCGGEGGALYVNSLGRPYPVMRLSCSTGSLQGPSEVLTSGVDSWCSGMCYIPEPYRCLVLCVASEAHIRAISRESGEPLWVVEGEIDGARCHLWGVLYLQQRHLLLVCDGCNNRVLVLHPGDGSHLQTVRFPAEMHGVYDLFLLNDQIIMHHNTNVSFLTLTVCNQAIEK